MTYLITARAAGRFDRERFLQWRMSTDRKTSAYSAKVRRARSANILSCMLAHMHAGINIAFGECFPTG